MEEIKRKDAVRNRWKRSLEIKKESIRRTQELWASEGIEGKVVALL